MTAYRDHARDVPVRVRTSVPALAACLLALGLGVLGARVDRSHQSATDRVEMAAPASGTDGAAFSRSVGEAPQATEVEVIAIAGSPAHCLSLYE